MKASSPCLEYKFQHTSTLQIGTVRLIIPLSYRELSSPVPIMAELSYGLENFHWQLLDHTCRQDNSNREKMITSWRTLSYIIIRHGDHNQLIFILTKSRCLRLSTNSTEISSAAMHHSEILTFITAPAKYSSRITSYCCFAF